MRRARRGRRQLHGAFSARACGPAVLQATISVDGADIASAPLTCSPALASSSGVNVSGKAVVNGVASVAVTVASINDCGMPAPGRPVILSSTIRVLAATSGTTDAAGAFTTTIIATVAGNRTISATVDGVALAPTSVRFDPKPPSGGGCSTGLEGGIFALLGVIAAVARRRRG